MSVDDIVAGMAAVRLGVCEECKAREAGLKCEFCAKLMCQMCHVVDTAYSLPCGDPRCTHAKAVLCNKCSCRRCEYCAVTLYARGVPFPESFIRAHFCRKCKARHEDETGHE